MAGAGFAFGPWAIDILCLSLEVELCIRITTITIWGFEIIFQFGSVSCCQHRLSILTVRKWYRTTCVLMALLYVTVSAILYGGAGKSNQQQLGSVQLCSFPKYHGYCCCYKGTDTVPTSKNKWRQRPTVASPHLTFIWETKWNLNTATDNRQLPSTVRSIPAWEAITLPTSRWQWSVLVL